MKQLNYRLLIILVLPLSLAMSGCQLTTQPLEQQQQVLQQAQQWYQQGDLLAAEQQLNRLHRNNLKSPNSWRLLDNIHFRQQRMQAAEKAYLAALKLEPSDAVSWHNLALVRLRLTTSTLMSARTQLGSLSENDTALLDTLLKLQRVKLN
ncbi:MAG: hypothetical protein ACQEQ8_01485 [Pseudomonadota bacterium]